MRSFWKFMGIALLIQGGICVADDLNPPPWRGLPGTTYAEWNFFTPDPNPPPDVNHNPFGVPQAQVFPTPGDEWAPSWGGRTGVWPLSGYVDVQIPNFPSPNAYKDIWVQITWDEKQPNVRPAVEEWISDTPATLIDERLLEPTGEPFPAGPVWRHSTYLVRIFPNPQFEIVRIQGVIMLDQLVIDTICIPEPGSLAFMALGGLVLVLRRR